MSAAAKAKTVPPDVKRLMKEAEDILMRLHFATTMANLGGECEATVRFVYNYSYRYKRLQHVVEEIYRVLGQPQCPGQHSEDRSAKNVIDFTKAVKRSIARRRKAGA
jgi:hypothetical protein